MGEEVSDERFDDTVLLALTDDFEFIRRLHHRDRSFLELQKEITTRHIFINNLSRPGHGKPKTADRRAAILATDLSGVQCHNCKRYRYYENDCPQPKNTKPTTKKEGLNDG